LNPIESTYHSSQGKGSAAERAKSARQTEALEAQLVAAKLQMERSRAQEGDSNQTSTSSSNENGGSDSGNGGGGESEKAAEGANTPRWVCAYVVLLVYVCVFVCAYVPFVVLCPPQPRCAIIWTLLLFKSTRQSGNGLTRGSKLAHTIVHACLTSWFTNVDGCAGKAKAGDGAVPQIKTNPHGTLLCVKR
jgi:hypothetical protein